MSSSSAPEMISNERSAPSISISDFQIVRLIGQGFCGKVFLATDIRTNTQVALKVIPKTKSLNKWAIQEQAIQASLDDKAPTFLLPLLCSWHDTMNFYLVTEYLGGNDMAFELESSRRFTESRTRYYAAELIVALEQMRAHGVIHRDIKPGNILFTKDGHIRLTDFGLSKKFCTTIIKHPNDLSQTDADHTSFTASEAVGTPAYMSIEAHLGQPYSFDVDVHALGVVIYQMLTGKLPFGERAVTAQQLRTAILDGSFGFEATDDVSKVTQDFIRRLLVKKPCDLISLDEMKRHPFFKGVKWDRVRKQTLVPPWKPSIPPIPDSLPKCFVAHGKPYEILDPHPEFHFISPRLPRPKAHRTGFFGRLFKSGGGMKIGLSNSPSKTVPAIETTPPTASPLEPPTPPRVPISASSSDFSTGGLSNSIPVKQHWPSNSVLIVHPPATSLLHHPKSTLSQSTSHPSHRPSTKNKRDPRGRLPSPLIRHHLRNRPRPSTAPRPPFINVFYSTDSLAHDSNSPPAQNVSESHLNTNAAPKYKLSNTPVKRSPLRNVTNSSDCLRPSSAANMPRRVISSAKPLSNIEVHSENRLNTIVKPAIKFHSIATTPNNISTLHIPAPTPIRKHSLESLLPSTSTFKPAKPEADVDQSRPIIFAPEGKNDLDARFKSTFSKMARRSKASTVDLDDDDLVFRCRGDPEALEPPATPETSQSTSSGKENRESQAVNNTHISSASDACVSQTTGLPDFNNITPGVYPRALERAEVYTHPALAYAHAKAKPADYPRPVFKSDVDLKHWYPSIEEAFALPPREPPKPPKFPRRLVLPDVLTIRAAAATSPPPPPPPPSPTPSWKYFDSDSPTLSAEGRSWLYYGHSSPALKITGEELKAHINDTITQARRDVYMHAESGIFPSARQCNNTSQAATPQPIVSGPHYAGSQLPASRSGPLVLLRRYYIRLLMACGRLISCSNDFRTLPRI